MTVDVDFIVIIPTQNCVFQAPPQPVDCLTNVSDVGNFNYPAAEPSHAFSEVYIDK